MKLFCKTIKANINESKIYNAIGIIGILFISFIIAKVFYLTMYSIMDDAGTTLYAYLKASVGRDLNNARMERNPYFILEYIISTIRGMRADSSSLAFAIWYFFCMVITGFLACSGTEKKQYWLIPFVLFYMIPNSNTNHWHIVLILSTLIFFLIIEKIQKPNKKKKEKIGIGILLLIFAYFILFSDDLVLAGIYIVIPSIIYIFISLMQDERRRKYVFLVIVLAVSLVCFLRGIEFFTGKAIGSYNGYGGEAYARWAQPEKVLENIKDFWKSIFRQNNLDIAGGFLQYKSIIWCIRMLIITVALMIPFKNLVVVLKKGIKILPIIDVIASLTIIVSLFVNIFNGYNADFPGTIDRYLGMVWFLLPILLCREIQRKMINEQYQFIVFNKKYSFSKKNFYVLIFILLSLVYVRPIMGTRQAIDSSYQEVVEYLDSFQGLKYGLGNVEYAYPITVQTGGAYIVKWARFDYEGKAFRIKNDIFREDYLRGNNSFNYLILDADEPHSRDKERINSIFGNFIDMREFPDLNCIIYIFEHDIRFQTNTWEISDKDLLCQMDLPLGSIQVTVTGDNLNAEDIEFRSEHNRIEAIVLAQNKDKIEYRLENKTTGKILLEIPVYEDGATTIKRIESKVLRGAAQVEMSNGIVLIPTQVGSYFLRITGENIENVRAELVSGQQEIECQLVSSEKTCVTYKITMKEAGENQQIIIKNNEKGYAEISKIYYESDTKLQKFNFDLYDVAEDL